MLTDQQIKRLLQDKKISIEPHFDKNIKAGEYKIHLGEYLLVPKNQGEILDPADPSIQPEYEQIDIKDKPFILEPGNFVLGQTKEVIGLAADIGMFLDGSSTMARLGVTIHLSSMFIPPGQDPHIITLEMFNAGPWKIKLSSGLKVGKLVVFMYSEDNMYAAKTFNRYNGQKVATGAVIRKDNEA